MAVSQYFIFFFFLLLLFWNLCATFQPCYHGQTWLNTVSEKRKKTGNWEKFGMFMENKDFLGI